MNKSKFLKKSLAALLAVMLVVAMIPLSAAAANLPNMTMLYIEDSTVNVESNGTTFKYDIGRGTDSITVRPDKTILSDDTGTDNVFEVRPIDKSTGLPGAAILPTSGATLAFSTYGEESNGVVSITLRLWEKADPEHNFKDFTLELTRKDLNGEPVLASVSHDMDLGGDTGVFESSLDQSSHTVNVVVTRISGTHPTITLTTGEGSKIADANDASATAGSLTVDLSTYAAGMNKNTFYVVSQDGKKRHDWNVNVTKIDAMMSIGLGENSKYAGEFKDAGADPTTAGTPIAPVSANEDEFHDTIMIGIDRSEAFNADGTAKDVKLPVYFQAHGNVTEIKIKTHSKTSGNASTETTLKPGAEYNFGKISEYGLDSGGTAVRNDDKIFQATLQVKVDDNSHFQLYNLFVVLKKSDDKAIKYATIDGQIAKIEGTKITAVLPKYKKGTNTLTNTSKTTVELWTGLTVDSTSKINLDTVNASTGAAGTDTWGNNGNTQVDIPGTTDKGYKWVVSGTDVVNLSSSKIITVTAQDGSKLQYEISVTKAADDQNAVINSMTLKNNETEETYTGSIKDNTITFTVPYMTLDISTWKVFATCNDSAYIVLPGGGKNPAVEVDLISGTTEAKELATGTAAVPGITAISTGLATTANTNKGKIMVRNMNNSEVKIEYDVIINLEAPKAGNELTSLNFAALTDVNATKTFDDLQNMITDDNKFTTVRSVEDGKNILTYSPAFSLSTDGKKAPVSYLGTKPTITGTTGDVWNVVTSFTTSEGGVAFIGRNDGSSGAAANAVQLAPLTALSTGTTTYDAGVLATPKASNLSLISEDVSGREVYIVVLPEVKARPIALAAIGSRVVNIANVYTDNGGKIYYLKEEPASPSKESTMKTLKIKDTALTVGTYDSAAGEGRMITGELPYSYTVKSGDALSASNTFFPEFTLDKYAIWTSDGSSTFTFNSNGDTNGDGTADTVNAGNAKLYFVRNNDHTVDVYAVGGESGTTATGTKFGYDNSTRTPVQAEDRLDTSVTEKSRTEYKFKLTWADPNPNANITEFKVGNSVGVINGHNITVTVPFNTNLRSQLVSFTASPQATVKVGSTGTEVISGKTTLNFTAPITLQVKSEDGNKTETYVVTVREGNMFNDVHESDWFYSVVIEAATNNWITGRDATTFDPYSNMTRGEFATIIARIDLGSQEAVNNYTSDSRFPDVPTSHFASKGIAYCADKNYINGVGDGNFDPDSPITREQAAAIICRMKGIEAVDGDTTYADDAKISGWAKGLVKAVTANGIFEGEGADFNPQRNLRRCEGAAALVRAAKYVK